jgi:hypothetical protein
MTAPDRFEFGTRQKAGIIAGLDGPALALAILATGVALVALLVLPRPLNLLAAVAVILIAAGVLLVPLPTRTGADWARAAGGWAIRAAHGAASGSVVPVSSASAPVLCDLGIKLDLEDVRDGALTWGVHHVRRGSFVVVMSLSGQDFGLRDDGEQIQILSLWGNVLAALARKDSPVKRAQIVETAVPDSGEGAAGWFTTTQRARNDQAIEDYARLLDSVGASSTRHQCLLALHLVPRHNRDVEPLALVLTELSVLRRALAEAHVVARPLDSYAVAEALEAAIHPPSSLDAASARAARTPRVPLVGCVGWHESRDRLETDGWLHSSVAVSEWPRRPVAAGWLGSLLAAQIPAVRTISIHIAPLDARTALRKAERSITSSDAESEQKQKWGFTEHMTDQRAREALEAREAELAAGAVLTSLSAVLTVSAASPQALAQARTQIQDAAGLSQLEIESCWGSQKAAFIASLPLCRGGGRR